MTCKHRWSEPHPVWGWNQKGQLVRHPTELRILCLDCEAYKTVERKVAG